LVPGDRLQPTGSATSRIASKAFESDIRIKAVPEYRPRSTRQGARLAVEIDAS
jgi:hypothetical protein